tara:strand:+ start:521 stop:1153 length:633 start_codon:yes stop_codon:yes gene_type:complete
MTDKFIECVTKSKALIFGDFKLKSGIRSSYFINIGKICDNRSFLTLCEAYAETIINSGIHYDVIYGPAYKGIPLCIGISTVLANKGIMTEFSYNRKEVKKHGEKGLLIGSDINNKRILIVDDVITAGTAIRETIDIIKHHGGTVAGVVVAIDREEGVVGYENIPSEELSGGCGPITAIEQIKCEYNIPIFAISNITAILATLGDKVYYEP